MDVYIRNTETGATPLSLSPHHLPTHPTHLTSLDRIRINAAEVGLGGAARKVAEARKAGVVRAGRGRTAGEWQA